MFLYSKLFIIYCLYDLAYPLSYSFTSFISSASHVLILNQYKSPFSTCTILFIRSVIPTPSSISLFLKNLISKLLIRGVLCPNLIWWPSLFLIPFIRSLASVHYTLLTTSISLNSKIMSPCSYYIKKGLVCITIIALFSC